MSKVSRYELDSQATRRSVTLLQHGLSPVLPFSSFHPNISIRFTLKCRLHPLCWFTLEDLQVILSSDYSPVETFNSDRQAPGLPGWYTGSGRRTSTISPPSVVSPRPNAAAPSDKKPFRLSSRPISRSSDPITVPYEHRLYTIYKVMISETYFYSERLYCH